MHAGELHVDAALVRRLLDAQFPRWRGLAVSEVRSSGTVNAIFRVGPAMAARLPLIAQDPDEARAWLQAEAQAGSELARAATVPTPEPVALGEPGEGYPMPWSVQTWLPGHDAMTEDPGASPAFALDLAALITSLRAVGTRGRRFAGTGRGGHLRDHDEWLEVCFARSERVLDVPNLRAVWADLRSLPEVDADAMCHQDLTPPNVMVEGGRLAGVLDGGGFGPADPALDLVAAWHLVDDERRDLFREAVGSADVQWRRGMAWAFQQAVGLVWYYADSKPAMSAWGRRSLDRIARAA